MSKLIEAIKAGKQMLFDGELCTTFLLPVSHKINGQEYPIGVLIPSQFNSRTTLLFTVNEDGKMWEHDLIPRLTMQPQRGTVYVFFCEAQKRLWTTVDERIAATTPRDMHQLVATYNFTYEE